MKIKELIPLWITELDHVTGFSVAVKKQIMKENFELIKNCDEFSDVDELILLESPMVKDGEGNIIDIPTFKLNDKMKFKGKCYIYSISETPKTYNTEDLLTPVKDGVSVSPILYNYKDFSPYKTIVLPYNFNEPSEKLHELLDKVLDNIDEYTIPFTNDILIRGIFEEIQIGDIINKSSTPYPITTDLSEDVGLIAYYLKSDIVKDEDIHSVSLEKRIIPPNLKDKFIERFGEEKNLGILKEVELENFFENNK